MAYIIILTKIYDKNYRINFMEKDKKRINKIILIEKVFYYCIIDSFHLEKWKSEMRHKLIN